MKKLGIVLSNLVGFAFNVVVFLSLIIGLGRIVMLGGNLPLTFSLLVACVFTIALEMAFVWMLLNFVSKSAGRRSNIATVNYPGRFFRRAYQRVFHSKQLAAIDDVRSKQLADIDDMLNAARLSRKLLKSDIREYMQLTFDNDVKNMERKDICTGMVLLRVRNKQQARAIAQLEPGEVTADMKMQLIQTGKQCIHAVTLMRSMGNLSVSEENRQLAWATLLEYSRALIAEREKLNPAEVQESNDSVTESVELLTTVTREMQANE